MGINLFESALSDVARRQVSRAQKGVSPSTTGKTLIVRADSKELLDTALEILERKKVKYVLVEAPLKGSRDLRGLFALSDVVVLSKIDESLKNPFLPKVLATEVPIRGDLIILTFLTEEFLRKLGFLRSSSSPFGYFGPVEFYDLSHGYSLRESSRGWLSLPILSRRGF